MVTKHPYEYLVDGNCIILAKIHMVTKRKFLKGENV